MVDFPEPDAPMITAYSPRGTSRSMLRKAKLPAAIETYRKLYPDREIVQVQINDIAVGGGGALRRRIMEMGMTRGTELFVEKYAPLKDPLEVIVKGFHVSLRVEEASEITVEIME